MVWPWRGGTRARRARVGTAGPPERTARPRAQGLCPPSLTARPLPALPHRAAFVPGGRWPLGGPAAAAAARLPAARTCMPGPHRRAGGAGPATGERRNATQMRGGVAAGPVGCRRRAARPGTGRRAHAGARAGAQRRPGPGVARGARPFRRDDKGGGLAKREPAAAPAWAKRRCEALPSTSAWQSSIASPYFNCRRCWQALPGSRPAARRHASAPESGGGACFRKAEAAADRERRSASTVA